MRSSGERGFWLAALAVVLLDQATKRLVEMLLPLNGVPVTVIPGIFWLSHVRNPGVAFGQLQAAGPLLLLIAPAASAGILAYRAALRGGPQPLHPVLDYGLALALGGALGNLIDRLRLGEVIDFLDLGWWPVFNIADSAITVGALGLAGYFLFLQRPGQPAGSAAECGTDGSR